MGEEKEEHRLGEEEEQRLEEGKMTLNGRGGSRNTDWERRRTKNGRGEEKQTIGEGEEEQRLGEGEEEKEWERRKNKERERGRKNKE